MSTVVAAINPENLAFRFPRPIPGCDCAICTRLGFSDERKAILDNIPSVFIPHKLVKQITYQPPPDAATGTSKRSFKYDEDLKENEHKEFVDTNPTLAFSALPANSSSQPWIKSSIKLIKSIRKLKSAIAFNSPVDPVALNIPDYPTIVKHPMDLNTVEMKLSSEPSQYQSPEEFESDVRMIFCNAFLCPNNSLNKLLQYQNYYLILILIY